MGWGKVYRIRLGGGRHHNNVSASHIRSVLNALDPNDPNCDGYFRLTCFFFFEEDPRGTARGNKKMAWVLTEGRRQG